MKIAFFDSGLGGITVLKEALQRLPAEDYIYYADTRHVPYGPKPKEEVRGYIFEAIEYLASQHIKALVVACNTATSIAVRDLRSRYTFPVIGMEPAVKPAVRQTDASGKRVLVLATALTLKESKFKDLVQSIDPHHIVDSMPMPELVELAEQVTFDETVVVPLLRQKFSGLDLSSYGTVVLGCTHFPFFVHSFEKVLPPGTEIIDGAAGTVQQLSRKLGEAGLSGKDGTGQIAFCSSGGANDEQRLRQAFEFAISL